MASVFLGVRLPEKPYERHQIKDIDFSTKNVADLKTEAEKLLNTPKDDLGSCTLSLFIRQSYFHLRF